jgi:hypothetical protein
MSGYTTLYLVISCCDMLVQVSPSLIRLVQVIPGRNRVGHVRSGLVRECKVGHVRPEQARLSQFI